MLRLQADADRERQELRREKQGGAGEFRTPTRRSLEMLHAGPLQSYTLDKREHANTQQQTIMLL